MTPRPPQLAERLLAWSVPSDDRDAALGDLAEEYAGRAERHGLREARRWYWRQALRSIAAAVRRRALRPLAYPQADRIVSFAWRFPTGDAPANITPLTFAHWRDHARAFSAFAVVSDSSVDLLRAGMLQRVPAVARTAGFFRGIGVAPAIGRPFTAEGC